MELPQTEHFTGYIITYDLIKILIVILCIVLQTCFPEEGSYGFLHVSHLMKTDRNGLPNSGEFPDLLFGELGY